MEDIHRYKVQKSREAVLVVWNATSWQFKKPGVINSSRLDTAETPDSLDGGTLVPASASTNQTLYVPELK